MATNRKLIDLFDMEFVPFIPPPPPSIPPGLRRQRVCEYCKTVLQARENCKNCGAPPPLPPETIVVRGERTVTFIGTERPSKPEFPPNKAIRECDEVKCRPPLPNFCQKGPPPKPQVAPVRLVNDTTGFELTNPGAAVGALLWTAFVAALVFVYILWI